MSDFNANRPGQVNATGDARALFLKKFSGEVLTAFHETNVMMPLHMVKTIESGKSYQFPVTGVASAKYHTVGTELLGSSIKHAERVITIDQLLVSDAFIANIDEAMNHYDARSVYTGEMGKVLAETADQNLVRLAVLAARASSVVSGGPSGTVINTISNTTNASLLIDAIFAAAQALDDKKIPKRDRYLLLRPQQFYVLVKDTTAINRDWNAQGSFAEGTLPIVAGLRVIPSIHVPSTVVASNAGVESPNDYSGDFSKTVGVAFHRAALGTVKLLDLSTEMEYSVRHQGTFMVSRYAMGHGILRPECSVELSTP